jgi:hypothetical protein
MVISCPVRFIEYEATRLSRTVALGVDWRCARSFLDAVDVASEGAVALDLISFGRWQGGLRGDDPLGFGAPNVEEARPFMLL